jgi:hypothetical protein
MSDVQVIVGPYTVTETRERGGMCGVEMDFVEYGDPSYRPTASTPGQIAKTANALDNAVISQPTTPEVPAQTTNDEARQYTDIWAGAAQAPGAPSPPISF